MNQIIVLIIFSAWFVASTGRSVTAGALVSNVVPANQRGSFQSFNSSFQQLGTGLAALVSGLIVSSEPSTNKLIHYNYLGLLSIVILLFCTFLANKLFKNMEKNATHLQNNKSLAVK